MRIFTIAAVLFLVTTAISEETTLEKTRAATKKAVDFLIQQQNEDGTFGKSKESAMPGLVALVVEALAKSPDKPRRANTPAIAKAVTYILAHQQSNGSIAIPEFGLENYNTSVAVIGLAALEDPGLGEAIQKARDFILSAQSLEGSEENPTHGGFGYGPGKKVDLSNTGFSLEALKAAGVKEDSPTWKNAVLFIKRCQDNSETNDVEAMKGGPDSGGFVYAPGESPFGTEGTRPGKKYVARPYGNMTYEAVKSLIIAGMKRDDPAMQAAFKWIRKNYSVKENPGAVGHEGYYYYVIAMAKALTTAGVKELDTADGKKVNWAKELAAQLISMQRPDGSFVNDNTRWIEGNPVLATSYALTALSLCADAMK